MITLTLDTQQKPTSNKKENDGKALEGKLSKALKTFEAKTKAFHYRIPDTSAARKGILPPAVGDYILLIPGKAVLIECKSTVTGIPLLTLAHKNKVQIAHHRQWHRAGHPSLYLWYDIEVDKIEYHTGELVVQKVHYPLFTGKGREIQPALKEILEKL
jgi:penicillin-binding protein-related factor A (putative recombinase)